MISISLCFKIHIPAIQNRYRFFNINSRHPYFDDARLKNHTLKVYTSNLLPFFETVKFLSSTGGHRFKAAISVSGITLELLKRFAPRAVDSLSELYQQHKIEFLSGTWSNSLLAHLSDKLMKKQIAQHDAQMSSMFGAKPDVFIMYSPVCTTELFNSIFDSGKKTILLHSNHFDQTIALHKDVSGSRQAAERQMFPINQMASQRLYEIGLNQKMKPTDKMISRFYKKFKSDISLGIPQAIVFNPGDIKNPWTLEYSMIWKMIVSRLLTDKEIRFVLPSELKNETHGTLNQTLLSENENCGKLPDLWMKNNLQKDSVNRLLELNSLIPFDNTKSVPDEWDILHDMEYLFYMDNHFFRPEFAENHFNPFSGPYEAYTNYMNILDDFKARLSDNKKDLSYIQSNFQNSESG